MCPLHTLKVDDLVEGLAVLCSDVNVLANWGPVLYDIFIIIIIIQALQ